MDKQATGGLLLALFLLTLMLVIFPLVGDTLFGAVTLTFLVGIVIYFIFTSFLS